MEGREDSFPFIRAAAEFAKYAVGFLYLRWCENRTVERNTAIIFFVAFQKKESKDEENDDVHAYVFIFVCVSWPHLKIGRRSQQIPTGKNGGRTGTVSEKPSSTFCFRKDCGVFRLWGQGPHQKTLRSR